ncbi:MAG: hypothetical protein ACREO8_01795 [Luteimonas sp.]
MANINRRQLLKGAVLGTAGTLSAAAFSVLAQPAPDDATVLAAGSVSPFFTEGLVQRIAKSTITALDTENLVQHVVIADSTRVWKGVDTTLADVNPGDFFYARGRRGLDGHFMAETIWFNIVSLPVEIIEIEQSRIQFIDSQQTPGIGRFMSHSVAVQGEQAASRDFSALSTGSYVQIIGVMQPKTGEIEISRILM